MLTGDTKEIQIGFWVLLKFFTKTPQTSCPSGELKVFCEQTKRTGQAVRMHRPPWPFDALIRIQPLSVPDVVYIYNDAMNLIESTVVTLSIGQAILSIYCSPRSDAAERGVLSGSTLFATHQEVQNTLESSKMFFLHCFIFLKYLNFR